MFVLKLEIPIEDNTRELLIRRAYPSGPADLSRAKALRDGLVVVNPQDEPPAWRFQLTAEQVVELEHLLGIA